MISLYFRLTGFKAFTTIWGKIYFAPGWDDCIWLRKHEEKHLEQMAREGKLRFLLKYTWYLIRYGYLDNPYEQEARAAELT